MTDVISRAGAAALVDRARFATSYCEVYLSYHAAIPAGSIMVTDTETKVGAVYCSAGCAFRVSVVGYLGAACLWRLDKWAPHSSPSPLSIVYTCALDLAGD
jgi:hypothetical protein